MDPDGPRRNRLNVTSKWVETACTGPAMRTGGNGNMGLPYSSGAGRKLYEKPPETGTQYGGAKPPLPARDHSLLRRTLRSEPRSPKS